MVAVLIVPWLQYWESAHPALNEWAADGSYEPGAYVCEGAEGFVFDGEYTPSWALAGH